MVALYTKDGKRKNKGGGRPLKRRERGRVLDPIHFKCVDYFMQGMTQTEAMKKAGYSESYSRKYQANVFGRQDVLKEIEYRQNASRQRNARMVDRVTEELGRVAFFNIGEILEVTEDGQLVYDFTELTLEQASAIGEVSVETYMEGRGEDAIEVKRVKVKPYDKKGALDSLARIFGMFKDNLNVTAGEKSLEERLQEGRRRLNKLEADPSPDPEAVDAEWEEVEEDDD